MARVRARITSFLLALGVLAGASLTWPLIGAEAAAAAPPAAQARADLCTTAEWQADFRACVQKLQAVSEDEIKCRNAPTPGTPDSGLAGWFAAAPPAEAANGIAGRYSLYGYGGYSYNTYDVDGGCASSVLHPDYKFTTTIANGEFMAATAIIGASNALRERAWDPGSMWGWADPLVEQATKSVYQKVFSVFGIVTLCIVGLYLLWRSRQSDMSNAMTTAGWALLVMVAVTALAAWPVKSANIADGALVTSLGVVHDAVGPQAKEPDPGRCIDPDRCKDLRTPAVRASDTATETMLYRNWLRGVLGSADSETAQKYGPALYDAKSLTWGEAKSMRVSSASRDATIKAKQQQWARVAQQIKDEDPEAYEYLQGVRDMDRIGAGFIAVLAAVLFAMFDLTASLLVLLGFLIFRWAVIAAPILGTVGLLRPASAGLRRLANAVVAALFNIAIFGTGAAIYLFAVDLIMNTTTMPGWLQVVLVWLCGVVGWLLLRPYRRITQLGGKDSSEAVSSAGSWHRRFFRDMRTAARLDVAEPGGTLEPVGGRRRSPGTEQTRLRPEARREDPVPVPVPTAAAEGRRADGVRPDGQERSDEVPAEESRGGGRPVAPRPRRRQPATWTEPDVPAENPSFVVYRPGSAERAPDRTGPRVRSEAR
ncbi:MFS transporter [Micromonospora sp. WMMD1120]|uniref:MFS transporter n=1 Tax=Micromonospora sp. WMMD1120 TaxID=3016106 RepID=UPI002416F917|nr:MFS transporter [Micromonospora sp. WMMD1120]MDG4806632.1 MFS transporter [Micromonospora sp. WMMD1120]